MNLPLSQFTSVVWIFRALIDSPADVHIDTVRFNSWHPSGYRIMKQIQRPMTAPAFRRRILIEPSPGRVTAELEDDWHRMVVTIHHEAGIAVDVAGEMKRWPWTSCPGAIQKLAENFAGCPLTAFPRRGEKARNCTHLHDLAVLAAAHAGNSEPTTYDVGVTEPIDGRRAAWLSQGGQEIMTWSLAGGSFVAPTELVGSTLNDLNPWIAGLEKPAQEAARILRWAAILGYGRGMAMPAGMSATAFPEGSCFTFQPDTARDATRRNDADVDFSTDDCGPLADRADMFS